MIQTLKKLSPLLAVTGVLAVLCTLLLAVTAGAQAPTVSAAIDPAVLTWGYAMAAASTAVSSTAAAFAVAKVGSAAVAAMTEKPELFGRMVVLVGLSEGIAIYGLIVSILVLNKLPT